jgi:predicted RNA-binding protein with PIN domain
VAAPISSPGIAWENGGIPMNYLIDGYNLLFTLGLAGKRVESRAFERARQQLLDWIRSAHGTKVGAVTVVFDGVHAPENSADAYDDRGLHICFAVGQLADDLIEVLIRAERHPERLTVVSSDHRIQTAARRRGCIVCDATEYVDWVIDQGHEAPKPPKPALKPDSISDADKELWMKEFGAIDEDPQVKKFNRPFDEFRNEQ